MSGEIQRPKTRGECANGPRPCPWVGCRHHLYLKDMPRSERRAHLVQLTHHTMEPWEMPETCSLDIADGGDARTLDEVGTLMGVTREAISQTEEKALLKIRARGRFGGTGLEP